MRKIMDLDTLLREARRILGPDRVSSPRSRKKKASSRSSQNKTAMILEIEERIGEPLREYLHREHTENKKSQLTIGDDLGVSQSVVGKWMSQFGVDTSREYLGSSGKTEKMIEVERRIGEPLEEYTRREYETEMKPVEQIADDLGVHKATLGLWMHNWGIEVKVGSRRTGDKTKHMQKVERRIGEPLELYLKREFEKNKKSRTEVGKALRVCGQTTGYWAERLGVQVPPSQNKAASLKYCIEEAKKLKKSKGLKRLPRSDELEEIGYGWLARAVTRHYGGYTHFRSLLGEEMITRPLGFFSKMTDKELIAYIKEHGKGMSVTEFMRVEPTACGQARNRDLVDKLVSRKVLVRRGRRPFGFFRRLSDEEVMKIVSENFKGYAITQVEEEDPTVLNTIRDRGLVDKLVAQGVLVRKSYGAGFYSKMSDKELMQHTREKYKGKGVSELEEEHSGLIHLLRARKLLDGLVEEGALVRVLRKNIFGGMSDRQVVSYVKRKYHGKTLTQLFEKEKSAYKEVKKRGLDDLMIERGILSHGEKTRKGYFSGMNREELADWIRENYSGKPLNSFMRRHNRAYDLARRRGILKSLLIEGVLISEKGAFERMSNKNLLDWVRKENRGRTVGHMKYSHNSAYKELESRDLLGRLVEEGVLVTKRGKYPNMSDEQLIDYVRKNYQGRYVSKVKHGLLYALQERGLIDRLVTEGILVQQGKSRQREDYSTFLKQDETAKSIASLSSLTDNASDVADILVQLWPGRFPAASQLARSLPGAVRRIGYSLQPFTLDKTRGLYEKAKALPRKVTYQLDTLLYGIAIEQYQPAFNTNPEKTIRELERFASEKNGVRRLAGRVLDYYAEIYDFSIPGRGKLKGRKAG